MAEVQIVDFKQEYASYFLKLNLAWLEEHFFVENYDREVLSNPEKHILDKGGVILFATHENEVVGTLALINRNTEGLELSKMAVDKAYQGLRIGQRLIYAAINKAGELGVKRLFLDSNTRLKPAINLYQKVGFKEVKAQSSPYERCNIRMEILL